MAKETYKTWLPVFPGFYNTGFLDEDQIGYEIDRELEYYADEYDLPLDLVKYLVYQCFCQELMPWIDNNPYEDELARKCCDWVEETLREIFEDKSIKVEFEKVVRPREYNFKNDAVDIKVTIDLDKVFGYVEDNLKDFKAYIKDTYTSCDGFISHYSPNVEDWLDYGNWDVHQIGAVLNFVINDYMTTSHKYADEQMLWYAEEHVYSGEYIRTPDKLTDILKSTFFHELAEEYMHEYARTRVYLCNRYLTDTLNSKQQRELLEHSEEWLEWLFGGFATPDELWESCDGGETFNDYLRRIA